MLEYFIDFIKDHYFLVAYAITLVVSLLYYERYFDTTLKYYPILIAYTFLNELLGYLIKKYPQYSFFDDLKDSNINELIYNIYAFIFFCFFYLIYWQLVQNSRFKKWIIIGFWITTLSYVISCFFQNPIATNLYYATATGSWVLIFCVILYFRDKHLSGKSLVQSTNLMFWLSISLLIFYSIFPILYLIGYLDYPTWVNYNLLTVLRLLIIIMYTLQIIGFVKGRKRALG